MGVYQPFKHYLKEKIRNSTDTTPPPRPPPQKTDFVNTSETRCQLFSCVRSTMVAKRWTGKINKHGISGDLLALEVGDASRYILPASSDLVKKAGKLSRNQKKLEKEYYFFVLGEGWDVFLKKNVTSTYCDHIANHIRLYPEIWANLMNSSRVPDGHFPKMDGTDSWPVRTWKWWKMRGQWRGGQDLLMHIDTCWYCAGGLQYLYE